MISIEEHLDNVVAGVRPLPVHTAPIGDCLGLVLAEDCAARLTVPPFTNSAMDGFAVRAAEVATPPVRLTVTADIPAGTAPSIELSPGTAQRIMTGAMVPDGADAVVPVELTDIPPGPHGLPGAVEVREAVAAGQHVRYAGGDVGVGEPIAAAGTRLTAAALSSLVSVGYGELAVHARPRVAVLATGEELAAPGVTPAPGHIPDSNTTLVAGLVREAGCDVVHVGRSGDTPDELRAALAAAAAAADLIVTTGGVSAGAYDVVKEATSGAGVTFTQIAMQPGKPQGFGVLGDQEIPVFTLPGNPVSSLVSFEAFVAPALRLMAGRAPFEAAPVVARVEEGFRSPAAKTQFARVVVTSHDAEPLRVKLAGGQGSHVLGGLAEAHGLAVVPPEVSRVEAGDEVLVLGLDGTHPGDRVSTATVGETAGRPWFGAVAVAAAGSAG